MANSKSLGVRSPGQLYKVITFPTAASQTFVAGDFLVFVGSGTVGLTAAAANNAAYPAVTGNATRLAGRAVTPAVDSTLGTLQPQTAFISAVENVEFMAPLYSATPATAVPGPTLIGSSYGMRQSSGGFPQINLDEGTNVYARITDFDLTDYPGWPAVTTAGTTQYANAWFVVIGSASLLSTAR